MKISVSKGPPEDGIISCRNVAIRERLLRFLLGKKQKLTVLVPGDCVEEVTIYDAKKKTRINRVKPLLSPPDTLSIDDRVDAEYLAELKGATLV